MLDGLARRNFNGYEQECAVRIVAQLRAANALGTISGSLREGAHECVRKPTGLHLAVCDICGRPM